MVENEKEVVFQIGAHFLAVQETSEEYEYSVYDAEYKLIDGGQYEAAGKNLRAVSAEILAGEPWLNGAEHMDTLQRAAYATSLVNAAATLEHEELLRRADAAHYAPLTGMSASDYLEAGEKAPAGRKFHIYQLKSGEENHLLRFCGLDVLQRERGMGFAPELKNYELVYSGVMKENETLEDIYSRFNVDLPKDFFGHSLSVSDVVAVEWNGHLTANYVDSIGFQNFPQMAQEITQQQNELLSLCQAIADYDAAHGTESAFIEYDYDKDGWQPCDGTTLEQLKASYPQCVKPSFEVLQFRCKDEVYQAQIKFEGKTSWAGMRRQSGQLYVVTGSRVVGDWQRLNFNAQQVAQYEAFLNRHLEQEACISR